MSYNNTYQQQPQSPDYDLESGNQDFELTPVGDPHEILNKCSELNEEIRGISQKIQFLREQYQICVAANENPQAICGRIGDDILQDYRYATERLKTLQSLPQASQNAANVNHVNRSKRTLGKVLEEYTQTQQEIDRDVFAANKRAINVATNGNLGDEEVTALAQEQAGSDHFAQALANSDRKGESQRALNYNQTRRDVSEKIVKDLTILNQLFLQLSDLVEQQGEPIKQMEKKTDVTVQEIQSGTKDVGVGIEKAKARNRKKWWCALIITLIVIIIIAIVVAVAAVFGSKK